MNHKPLLLLFFISFTGLQASCQSYDSLRNAIVKLLPPAGKYDESSLANDSMRYVKKNDKHGLLNKSFKEILPCVYDNITMHDKSGLITLFKEGKYGLANSAGGTILDCIYDEVQFDDALRLPDDAIHVTLNGKHGRVSYTGAIITPIQYDRLLLINNQYIAAKKGEKFGLIDRNNNTILPFIYDNIPESTYEQYIIVYNRDDGYGIVNNTGTVILPCRYNKIEEWGVPEGFFIVQLGSYSALIDSFNNVLLPFVYDEIKFLSTNNCVSYYKAKKRDFYGVVTATNVVVIENKYTDVLSLNNGIFGVKDTNSNKWGCINQTGKQIIPCIYDNVQAAGNGWICVQKNEQWGCVDTTHKIIIPISYTQPFHSEKGFITTLTEEDRKIYFDNAGKQSNLKKSTGKYIEIGSFVNGVAVVTDANDYKGLINKNGTMVLSCECETISDMKEGVAWCIKDGKYVLIDKKGRRKAEVMLNDATDFYEGLSLVQNINGYGFIDTAGKFKVLCLYEDGNIFVNGYASMKKDGKWGLINKAGRVVMDFKYDEKIFYSEGLVAVKENNKCYYVDIAGKKKIVLKDEIQDCSPFQDGCARVSTADKYGFINKSGNIVVPISLQHVSNFVKGRAIYLEAKDSKTGSVDKYGLIDKSGKKITRAMYSRIIISDSAGVIAVQHTYGCGMIGSHGEVLAPCIYEEMYLNNNSSGLFPAKLNGKWGYLNKQGKTIIPHKFDSGVEFSEGVAVVKNNRKWLIINTKGNTLAQIGEAD